MDELLRAVTPPLNPLSTSADVLLLELTVRVAFGVIPGIVVVHLQRLIIFSITECNQHFSSAVGHIASLPYAGDSVMTSPGACAIYVTGTPGKSVEITFHEFHLERAGAKDCVKVRLRIRAPPCGLILILVAQWL